MDSIGKRLHRLKASARLLICLGVALIVLMSMLFYKLEILTSILLTWDAFCLSVIALSWITFFSISHSELCTQAQRQDESRSITFILVLFAVYVSLVGILLLMKPVDESLIRKGLHRAISLLGIGLSWVLLHPVVTGSEFVIDGGFTL